MRISDWSSDVCSSDLLAGLGGMLVLDRCGVRLLGRPRDVLTTPHGLRAKGRATPVALRCTPRSGGTRRGGLGQARSMKACTPCGPVSRPAAPLARVACGTLRKGPCGDRTRAEVGEGGLVRVELGGTRYHNKTNIKIR